MYKFVKFSMDGVCGVYYILVVSYECGIWVLCKDVPFGGVVEVG